MTTPTTNHKKVNIVDLSECISVLERLQNPILGQHASRLELETISKCINGLQLGFNHIRIVNLGTPEEAERGLFCYRVFMDNLLTPPKDKPSLSDLTNSLLIHTCDVEDNGKVTTVYEVTNFTEDGPIGVKGTNAHINSLLFKMVGAMYSYMRAKSAENLKNDTQDVYFKDNVQFLQHPESFTGILHLIRVNEKFWKGFMELLKMENAKLTGGGSYVH